MKLSIFTGPPALPVWQGLRYSLSVQAFRRPTVSWSKGERTFACRPARGCALRFFTAHGKVKNLRYPLRSAQPMIREAQRLFAGISPGRYTAATGCHFGRPGTTMTTVISGRPARCIANKFTAIENETTAELVPVYPIAYDAGKALNLAAKAARETGLGAQWAGQAACLARKTPAATLVAELRFEMEQQLCVH